MKNISSLAHRISQFLQKETSTQPGKTSRVHWTDVLEKFAGKNASTEDDVLQAVNVLLVPQGPIRGQNNNLWYEPLPVNWRQIPLPQA